MANYAKPIISNYRWSRIPVLMQTEQNPSINIDNLIANGARVLPCLVTTKKYPPYKIYFEKGDIPYE